LAYPRFYNGGGSRGEGPGQGASGTEVPLKLKQNVKIVYKIIKRFPVENVGFNEYWSRAWTVYVANTQLKKILKIQWGGG